MSAAAARQRDPGGEAIYAAAAVPATYTHLAIELPQAPPFSWGRTLQIDYIPLFEAQLLLACTKQQRPSARAREVGIKISIHCCCLGRFLRAFPVSLLHKNQTRITPRMVPIRNWTQGAIPATDAVVRKTASHSLARAKPRHAPFAEHRLQQRYGQSTDAGVRFRLSTRPRMTRAPTFSLVVEQRDASLVSHLALYKARRECPASFARCKLQGSGACPKNGGGATQILYMRTHHGRRVAPSRNLRLHCFIITRNPCYCEVYIA